MLRKILIVFCCIVLSAAIGVGAYYGIEYYSAKEDTSVTNVNVTTSSLSASIDKIYNAVYVVESYSKNRLESSGTGFVYKMDEEYGYILTNEHVVEGSSSFVVTGMDEVEVSATLLGSDVFADLAVLRIPKESVLLVSEISDNTDMSLGDIVFTVGSPMGKEYFGTVTKGIVSGIDRLVKVSLTGENAGDWIMKVIQTDAAINPGNSGGPLCNAEGKVIGINTLKYSETDIEGMGFAIPIEYAMAHVDALENGEEIERPLLGVSMIDLDNTYGLYSAGLTPDEEVEKGVIVENVIEDSPAFDSGLRRGDIVLKIGDEELSTTAYLRYVLYKYNIGDTITVTYYRDGVIDTVGILLNKKYE
jgi:serine protease Do